MALFTLELESEGRPLREDVDDIGYMFKLADSFFLSLQGLVTFVLLINSTSPDVCNAFILTLHNAGNAV